MVIEIIEFTDPACTWCWGSEPILRKLETHYAGNIKINFNMGGLVEDIRNFRDAHNDIGGDLSKVNAQVAKHWLEASERHGMPVEAKGFSLFSEEHPSTYPMNIAFKAAQFQDEKLAKIFLRRMREAVAAEARQVNQTEVLIELAQESGFDVAQFIKSFSDGSAEKAFYEDLKITQAYKIHGFPSFLIKGNVGKEILLRGYQSYDAFQEVINHLTNGSLVAKRIEGTEEAILDFVNRFGRVAQVEIEVCLNLSAAKVTERLQSLKKQKLITLLPAGNGYFITPRVEPLSCNSIAGMCSF